MPAAAIRSRCGARVAAVVLSMGSVACGGHAARTLEIRAALDAGQPQHALQLLNEELGVDSEKQVPDDLDGDQAILLLDRAMVLQQLERFDLSSRDLQIADKRVELLDLSHGAMDDLGRYLFSDASGPYRAPAYEKLMINTMNMVNYLIRSDLSGARVEARRLAVMQRYLAKSETPGAELSAPGSYLAGFAFEKSGQSQEALRFYDEALKYGRYRTLAEPVRRLAESATYRSPRIRALLDDGASGSAPDPSAKPGIDPKADEASSAPRARDPHEGYGELLVIVNFGRVPAKYAKRIPIGLALTYASGAISPTDRGRANALAAQGLVTWINYPELGQSRGAYSVPTFSLDEQPQFLEGILAVDREARAAWEGARGAVVGSAITRMLARVVAGEAVRQGSGGGTLGLLLSLGTQATLTATDTPDTRCWATLPARIAFGRVWVKGGRHRVQLTARSIEKAGWVNVPAGGFAAVSLTVLH
ncbi:MAG: hypothetical protein R3B13_35715 [Polyangiaceae bacterium]